MMASSTNFVTSNLLCFVVNKFNKVPLRPLKSLVIDFFSANDVAEGKETLLKELDNIRIDNLPRVSRRRRDSLDKGILDVEDIISLITFLDENQHIKLLPKFVATSPDAMPSAHLVGGDLEFLVEKLSKLEHLIVELNEKMLSLADFSIFAREKFLSLESGITTVKASLDSVRNSIITNKRDEWSNAVAHPYALLHLLRHK